LGDNLEQQALIALNKNDAPGKFKNFLPLINHVVVYSSAVLPAIRANKEHKHVAELGDAMLVQTIAEAAGMSDLEKNLPSSESMLDAVIALGNVMGGSSGYNPVKMLSNVIGKEDMIKMMDEMIQFPLHFPEPNANQLVAAEQVALSVGLGFLDQDVAIQSFLHVLSKEQQAMVDSLEKVPFFFKKKKNIYFVKSAE
jgi:hypothetical protein